MYNLLCKLFIKDYQNTNDNAVREKYGSFFSIFSIILNVVMVILKLAISFITGSISIRADALNNLSDVGSNVAALFGFKLSNKHADKDHPYGHGRYEYISGMIIAFFILMVAFTSIKDSIEKIIHPTDISGSIVAIIALIISISLKLIMAYVNNKAGKTIQSETLLAAGQDSLNDVLSTSASLIAVIVYLLFHFNIDAYIGLLVSLYVLKEGISIFKDVMDTILGKAPDVELIKDIEKFVLGNKDIKGIHDLMMHDYGPSNQIMTFHAEVDYRKPVLELHEIIDDLEIAIYKKYGILTTIHLDPIVLDDPVVNEAKDKVNEIVRKINQRYKMHDFRMVKGDKHSNLIFDVVIPPDDMSDHEKVEKTIKSEVKKYNKTYNCVITVEHNYVDL